MFIVYEWIFPFPFSNIINFSLASLKMTKCIKTFQNRFQCILFYEYLAKVQTSCSISSNSSSSITHRIITFILIQTKFYHATICRWNNGLFKGIASKRCLISGISNVPMGYNMYYTCETPYHYRMDQFLKDDLNFKKRM
jgi:hypothetical protein